MFAFAFLFVGKLLPPRRAQTDFLQQVMGNNAIAASL